MKLEDFNVGDIVILKSDQNMKNPVKMTVGRVNTLTQKLHCSYSKDGKILNIILPFEMFVKE
ncbi:hypothetical protein M2459_002284 [Parabacteroides sp. PF5-5]|uniref:hypothetical protein n=1 Tax=unclassified Parabacteroides TaxID=2649774 RepID=UPI0024746489|nr:MULTISPECIES: hypothetical protein [unclassified Parabacteroides]MDH6305187.1 hypothetical protein [Parabacteroides sp. PH5-39]MDH6316537.1 hypothetical protein [Parabacteroides sp. PF5-13]MDH6320047.1 hypothetical protein [Parabacteroides sp. PH5-13]MDH6323720.1 hypothetical protein [Parabacteroides sp. PH5-8]MDH6327724.1 hypothetical protein [Parabacteroides sp. PH5-41]